MTAQAIKIFFEACEVISVVRVASKFNDAVLALEFIYTEHASSLLAWLFARLILLPRAHVESAESVFHGQHLDLGFA